MTQLYTSPSHHSRQFDSVIIFHTEQLITYNYLIWKKTATLLLDKLVTSIYTPTPTIPAPTPKVGQNTDFELTCCNIPDTFASAKRLDGLEIFLIFIFDFLIAPPIT